MTKKKTYSVKKQTFTCSTCKLSKRLEFKGNDNRNILCTIYSNIQPLKTVCSGIYADKVIEELEKLKNRVPLEYYQTKKEIKRKKTKNITNQLKLF